MYPREQLKFTKSFKDCIFKTYLRLCNNFILLKNAVKINRQDSREKKKKPTKKKKKRAKTKQNNKPPRLKEIQTSKANPN